MTRSKIAFLVKYKVRPLLISTRNTLNILEYCFIGRNWNKIPFCSTIVIPGNRKDILVLWSKVESLLAECWTLCKEISILK